MSPRKKAITAPKLPQDLSPDSDAANAFLLQQSGILEKYRYVDGVGWRSFREGHWRDVARETMLDEVSGVLRKIVMQYGQGAASGHVIDRKVLDQWTRHAGSASTLLNTLKFLSGMPKFYTQAENWDVEAHLLNVQNGVLNLITGELQPHSASFLLTHKCNAEYHPDASDPAIEKLLDTFRKNGQEAYMAQLVGKALYGAVLLEELIVLYGKGKTGKSTFVSAVMFLLGSYATALPIQSLLQQMRPISGNTPRPELYRLMKKRLVTATEPPEGAKLNAAEIKSLTGRDTLSVRTLHKEQTDFLPAFSLWLQTNFDLLTNTNDTGLERRIVVVPFDTVIEEVNESFKFDLQTPSAAAALLTWAVRGFQDWYGDGKTLNNCNSIVIEQATTAYWERVNPVAQFGEENLVVDPEGILLSVDLLQAFMSWSETHGLKNHPNATHSALYEHLRKLGAVTIKSNQKRGWKGVKFKNIE